MIRKILPFLIFFSSCAVSGNAPICISGTADLPNVSANFNARFYVYGVKGSVRSVVGTVCTEAPHICYPSNGSLSVVDNRMLISTQANDYIRQANSMLTFSTAIDLDSTTLSGTFGTVISTITAGNRNALNTLFAKGAVSVAKCLPESDVDRKILLNGLNKATKASK